MIKAVIFDMDGVLIDAKEWHYEALNRALLQHNFSINRLDHETIYDGLPTRKKLEILSQSEGLPRHLHSEINRLKQQFTLELINEYCRPCAEHITAFNALKKMNYKLAVASNSIRHTVELMMEKSKLNIFLDAIFSSSDVIHPKPHPEIYLTTITKLNLAPSECLVLEDHKKGIEAAEAAGAHVLVVKKTSDVTLAAIMARIHELHSYGR